MTITPIKTKQQLRAFITKIIPWMPNNQFLMDNKETVINYWWEEYGINGNLFEDTSSLFIRPNIKMNYTQYTREKTLEKLLDKYGQDQETTTDN